MENLEQTFSLVSPLFSDTQESEEEGSSRCRKEQAGHYFFLKSKCLWGAKRRPTLGRGRTPIESCDSLDNSLEDSVLKTGDICASGQEMENVHDTFQEVLAEVFVQRAEGY